MSKVCSESGLGSSENSEVVAYIMEMQRPADTNRHLRLCGHDIHIFVCSAAIVAFRRRRRRRRHPAHLQLHLGAALAAQHVQRLRGRQTGQPAAVGRQQHVAGAQPPRRPGAQMGEQPADADETAAVVIVVGAFDGEAETSAAVRDANAEEAVAILYERDRKEM